MSCQGSPKSPVCSRLTGLAGLSLALGAALVVPTPAALNAADAAHPTRQYDFPIYTNAPSGRQLSGQHAPASTPALTPEESQKLFKAPPGFEVRLFAGEPAIANPVAMTWDTRGRLWVVELYEYPLGAKPGEKGRDRIKILEDVDGDGVADKVTVFADGLNLATGIALGDGGVYVGQAPDLLFLKDNDGDDRADERKVVMTGFGLEDRHELLNGFTWGPDGALYMTHGVFTFSKVTDPANPSAPPVLVTAAVARLHTRTHRFEVYAEGTSNPWGVDFDREGNAFVSACVIDHFFHLAPGGLYQRQSGTPPHPYAYELLPSIVDHKHHMAAYSGVNIYQGNQYPREWLGHALMGNIHQNALDHDRLTPSGSSFKATAEQDFLTTSDGWFMPISIQCGPDGALWVMDWYDKYPCYQNANADPAGVDRERGRVWRVVYTGAQPGKPVPSRPERDMDLAKLPSARLVDLLGHPNVWQRRTAQHLLQERRDASTRTALVERAQGLAPGSMLEGRLAALWSLHGAGLLDESLLDRLTSDPEPAVRTWVARLTGERHDLSESAHDRLMKLASDPNPSVRTGVATAARQYVSGSLTVNTPASPDWQQARISSVIAAAARASADPKDPLLPFMIWMAVEPMFAEAPEPGLNWLAENGPSLQPLSLTLARKAVRRLCDLGTPYHLDLAVQFIDIVSTFPALAVAALDGLLEGQKGKAILPSSPTGPFLQKLSASSDPALKERAQRLGTSWGDATAVASTIAQARDRSAPVPSRIRATQTLRQLKTDTARDALIALATGDEPDAIVVEAIAGLGESGGDNVPAALVGRWKNLTPAARRAACDTLVSRRNWARALLAAVETRSISASDIPTGTIRALLNHKDDYVRNNAVATIGRFREADADKLKLIDAKRKVVLAGDGDPDKGRDIARKTCLICHKFHGEGAEVGPDLTGVGRSSLDALLHNVIHPNEVIGKGYEAVEIETKDGRVVSGRIVEDTDTRVRLLMAGPKEDVVAKSEIATRRVTELSVMPEGLEQMPDEDFRNLIWFILNPPEDKKPLTPQRRRELTGEESKPGAAIKPAGAVEFRDDESVALWNPEWTVSSGDAGKAPARLAMFEGRRNVLMTHPYPNGRPAALERVLEVPSTGDWHLIIEAGALVDHPWDLQVLVDGKRIAGDRIINDSGPWTGIDVALTPYAGQTVRIRLENQAPDAFHPDSPGYWEGLRLKGPTPSLRADR